MILIIVGALDIILTFIDVPLDIYRGRWRRGRKGSNGPWPSPPKIFSYFWNFFFKSPSYPPLKTHQMTNIF
jgi:hypothetical protein